MRVAVPIFLVDTFLVVATILAPTQERSGALRVFIRHIGHLHIAEVRAQLLCALHRRDISVIHFSRPHALRQLAQEYRDRRNCHRHCDPEHVYLDQWCVALLV